MSTPERPSDIPTDLPTLSGEDFVDVLQDVVLIHARRVLADAAVHGAGPTEDTAAEIADRVTRSRFVSVTVSQALDRLRGTAPADSAPDGALDVDEAQEPLPMERTKLRGRLAPDGVEGREALMDQIRATAYATLGRSDAVAALERRGELVARHGCDKARALLASPPDSEGEERSFRFEVERCRLCGLTRNEAPTFCQEAVTDAPHAVHDFRAPAIVRNESTENARRIWAAVDRAAEQAPQKVKDRIAASRAPTTGGGEREALEGKLARLADSGTLGGGLELANHEVETLRNAVTALRDIPCDCWREAMNMHRHGRDWRLACSCLDHPEEERCDCPFCAALASEPATEVRCTCEWEHPVDGSVDPTWPAELDPRCAVHTREPATPREPEREPDGWDLEYTDGSWRGRYQRRSDAEFLARRNGSGSLTGRIAPRWDSVRRGDPIAVQPPTEGENDG